MRNLVSVILALAIGLSVPGFALAVEAEKGTEEAASRCIQVCEQRCPEESGKYLKEKKEIERGLHPEVPGFPGEEYLYLEYPHP